MAIHVHYVTSFGLKGQSWKEVMESSSFIQKFKAFNISNAWQLVSVYYSHVESLGNLKNKYKTKKEKVRNQTTCITKFSQKKKERETDRPTEKKKKKRKEEEEEEEEEAVASWRHPCFVVVFFLFSFFSVFFPYKWNFSCFARYPFTGRKGWISSVQPLCSRYFFRYKKRGLSIPMH